MRYLISISLFLIANVLIAQSPITSLEIEQLLFDSTFNSRALEVKDGNVYVATSDGRVMKKGTEDERFSLLWPVDTLHKPHFRSLAVTSSGVFALGIEAPALLYKNGEIVYRENNEKAFYDSMEFWNEEEGIAMGDPTDGCISVIITRDSGETWTKVPCADLPPSPIEEAAFAASDSNIKTLGDHTWIATGGKASRIFYSPDKGHSWEVYSTPIIQGKPTTGMYSVDFYNDQIGFAIGGDYTSPDDHDGNKISSKDGGKTWQLAADGEEPGFRSCVQYVPGSEGQQLVAIGFRGIDVSNDGGTSWTHLSDEGFYTLRFIGPHLAYAAGSKRVARLLFGTE